MGWKTRLTMLLLVGALASYGCTLGLKKEKKQGIYHAARAYIGFDIIRYDVDLGKKIQTTPVHPGDSGFLSGATTTDVGGGWDCAPKVRLESSFGNKNFRLRIGTDVRYNVSSLTGYREGIYDTRQQTSDTRPPGSGSFVYTQLKPDSFTYVPSIGLEATILENIILNAEYGFPYTGFEVSSGHDRYGKWQAVQEDSWKGFGRSIGGGIDFILDDEASLSLLVRQERYKPEFIGEKARIDALIGTVVFRHEF